MGSSYKVIIIYYIILTKIMNSRELLLIRVTSIEPTTPQLRTRLHVKTRRSLVCKPCTVPRHHPAA